MISAAIGLQLTHIGLMLFMSTRPGFLAGTGTAHLVSCSLLSPVASLGAQSVDSRPSCEACLCRAEFVYDV